MSSVEGQWNADDRQRLLAVAHTAIEQGFAQRGPLLPDPDAYSPALRRLRSSFVTLEINRELRGCIGALEPTEPLVVDVARHAYAAAFDDPRFPPLAQEELPQLSIHLSVLNPAQPLAADSESALLAQLRPGVDGLILREGWRRATFLPSVWDALSDARDFLAHLKLKAGLPASHWSDTISFERYTVDLIE